MSNDILLAELEKTKNSTLRLMVRQFRGNQFIDLREWFLTRERVWVGTRKGITFSEELIPEVIEMILTLEKYLLDE